MNSTDMQMEQFLAELEQRLRETPGIEDALEGLLFFLGFFISIIAVVAVIGVIAWILQRFAYWKIFVKAGEKGWKALKPLSAARRARWQSAFLPAFASVKTQRMNCPT